MQTIDETLIVRGRKCVFHQRESQPTNTQIFTLARSGWNVNMMESIKRSIDWLIVQIVKWQNFFARIKNHFDSFFFSSRIVRVDGDGSTCIWFIGFVADTTWTVCVNCGKKPVSSSRQRNDFINMDTKRIVFERRISYLLFVVERCDASTFSSSKDVINETNQMNKGGRMAVAKRKKNKKNDVISSISVLIWSFIMGNDNGANGQQSMIQMGRTLSYTAAR